MLGLLVAASTALIAPAVSAAAPGDWATFGYTPGRSGYNPSEQALGPANVGSLREVWSVDIGGVNAQPLLASGVKLSPTSSVDIVYAGTEGGHFAAVNAANGAVIWKRTLGVAQVPQCSATYGITSTPVLDRRHGSVYVVDGRGVARELSLATGATRRKWTITTNLGHEHVWSGLTLARGILYVPVGGDCDNPPYRGRVVAIDTATGKRIATWYVTGRNGPEEAEYGVGAACRSIRRPTRSTP